MLKKDVNKNDETNCAISVKLATITSSSSVDSHLIKLHFSLVTVFVIGDGKKSRSLYVKEEVEEDFDGAAFDMSLPRYKQSRQKNLQLLHNGYIYCRDSNRGNRIYWRCRLFRNGKCGARLITIDDKIISESRAHTHDPEEHDKSVDEECYEEMM